MPPPAAARTPPTPSLTKNQKKKARQKRARAHRGPAGDRSDGPRVVRDTRTPSSAWMPPAKRVLVHVEPCAGGGGKAPADGESGASTATAAGAAGGGDAPSTAAGPTRDITAAGDGGGSWPSPPPPPGGFGGGGGGGGGGGDSPGAPPAGAHDGIEAASTPSPSLATPPAVCRTDLSATAAAIAAAIATPPRPAAPVGNYARYYGYRLAGAAGAVSPGAAALLGPGASDPRVAALRPFAHLFAGRPLLDVGCNEGVVTLAVAAACGVGGVLGVDIDPALVRRAAARLRRHRAAAAAHSAALRDGAAPAAGPGEPGGASPGRRRAAAAAAAGALRCASFVAADFAAHASAVVAPASCGGALCLSVTKWVHLRGGDAALDALFAALAASLAPGGHLVLEPQPWRSYERAVRKPGVAAACVPLGGLRLRPPGFGDRLRAAHGLTFVRRLDVAAAGSAGFDRPLLLFRKDGGGR